MPATVDSSKFLWSVGKMASLPKKVVPDVVNKSVLKVALGSKGSVGLVQLTQKATQTRIKRDLKRNKLGLKLAVISLRRKGEHKKPGNWNQKVQREYQLILGARLRSRAYIAAAWLFAAGKLARRVPGQKLTRLNPKSVPKWEQGTAAQSSAAIASAQSLTAGLFNAARGAGAVCPDQVLQIAINEATNDNLVYLRKKFGAEIDAAISALPPVKVADP